MDTGSPAVVHGSRRERSWTDAALYAGSAVVAWAALAASDLPLQRSWGRVAVWAYAVGAIVAPLVLRGSAGRRLLLAIAVATGAALVPLASAVAMRGDPRSGDAAQSEVFVVEEGARSLLDGRDPYAQVFAGPLASRPDATRSHVPYPPAMLVFGLPSAITGPGPPTDARVWFLLGSLAIAIPAIRAMRTDAEGRLRSFQVLFVLPTGALLLATGGHDVPVLATLLAAFVLADRRRADPTGVVSGVALAMRQTSVLAIPFVLTILPRRERVRALLVGAAVASLVAVPFLLWDPGAFIEDIVLFPLGLGAGRSSARTPTLGSILVDLAPGSRTPIAIGLVAAILASVVLLVTVRRPGTTAGASARAAVAFGIAIALAPAARFGYVVYPVSLAVWALAFRAGDLSSDEPATQVSHLATSATSSGAWRGNPHGPSRQHHRDPPSGPSERPAMVLEVRRYLGDARTVQVHDADRERERCRLGAIRPDQRRWYDSLDEALADLPYRPCPWCLGTSEPTREADR